ncbi:MAG: hypothetical protein RLZZ623_3623 [Actinomycetota bacterium]
MVDRTDNATNTGGHRTVTPDPPEHAEKPTTFDFKLRLGSRESTASLAGRDTGELVQLQPIDWEAFTGLASDEDAREYQTDSELQSIIVELATRIATPEELAKEAQRQQDEMAAAAAAVAAATVTPPPPAPAGAQLPAPTPAFVSLPVAAAVATPTPPPPPPPMPAAAAPVEPEVEVPVEVLIVEQTHNPSVASPVLAVNAAPVVGQTEPLPQPPDMTVDDEPEVVAEVVVAASAVKLTSNAEAMATAAAKPAVPALQLARIERRPDAERPTKPVDFHALLGQAGLQPAAVKKRKKRHPFRVLFKLLLVVGLLGAGAFYGKKYVLDKRWEASVKPFAEDVAKERELVWKRSVEVVDLRMKEYAPKLVASVMGAEPDVAQLQGQWRAMGLSEGELDLRGVGMYAASFRPAFYDPTDKKIYEVTGIAKDLREFFLDDALAHALLDQHLSWSTKMETLNPSQTVALRALVDGDARAVALAVVDPSASRLDDLNTEMQELANDETVTIGAARNFPVDLIIGGGTPMSNLFGPNVFADMAARTDVVDAGAASDAAVLDGVRTLDENPITFGADADAAGMLYWYYVLAGRLDDVVAWNAAVAWNGDQTVFANTTAGPCVTSTISAVDEASRQTLLDALTQWAALAPVEAKTTVTLVGTERIEVASCDPGTAADTMADGNVAFWGFAGAELAAVSDFDLARDQKARACTTTAIRAYGVHQMTLADDPAAADVILNVQKACASA